MNAITDKHTYNVIPQWGARPETAEALATRWLTLVARLQAIDPLLSKWTHWEKRRGSVPFDPRLDVQIARVVAGTTKTRDGQLFPRAGTQLWNTTDPCPRSKKFKITMLAGNAYEHNQLIGDTDYDAVPDPDLVAYRVFRGVLLAMAETFEATQARAFPSLLRGFWDDPRGIGPELDLAWISYVAPRFASLVTPPPSVVVEHRPDGGLMMAATTETFSTENPVHMAAAREIKAALAPYNAVPWTPETGK